MADIKRKKDTPSTKRDVPLTYAQRMELEGEPLPKKGSAQIVRGLRGLDPQVLNLAAAQHYGKDTSPNLLMDLPKMEAGDDSYERSGDNSPLNLTQEQIDNMTQEEWDNLPIVTGPKSGSPRIVNKLRNIK
tara:strand:- start:54 stop:446 length:393 start_codon:yes stop_codon:yes gene_type:complete